MKTRSVGGFLAIVAVCLSAAAAEKNPLPFISLMFGNNMVLQRSKPNTIWGWSKPGDAVRVEIADHAEQTVAATAGRWQVCIEPPSPGWPYTLMVGGAQPKNHIPYPELGIRDPR